MEQLDLRKIYKNLYNPSAKKVELVQVPRFNFLMADGKIEPGHAPGDSPMFAENVQALYSISYTLKFMLKQRAVDPLDYPVMALEGLWGLDDIHADFMIKDNWVYTVMIMQPDLITPEIFAEALAQARKKKGDLPGFARLRLEPFEEGLSVQIMHIGPYATEPATVARLRAFAEQQGYTFQNLHHEIYLGDPTKAAPDKLKTVLRHSVKPVGA